MKRVAVIQSNYIPWKGYFDIINDVDSFIFYDNVQYTKNDWRNRNKIKSAAGSQWITIPVNAQSDQLICDVEIPNSNWASKHYKTLNALYSKAPYFKQYKSFLEYIYMERSWSNLSSLNQYLIKHISQEYLGITTEFKDSREYTSSGKKLDRLIGLLKSAQTTTYLSGPAASDYIDSARFNEEGIELIYKDYKNYPEYNQFHPPMDHYVSILDLLFHTGPDSAYFIWGWRQDQNAIQY
ncbi:WbqC family protein [Paenibacillus sp. NPDC058174]|uniref:WbqC family protein n=1 Tax=Paenibacillus sp. NPDC058174 TaxID=3346366 RepID=UPI0036DE4691